MNDMNFTKDITAMPNILVTDSDFKRMQKLATPLVDTPTTIITKLLDSYENSDHRSPISEPNEDGDVEVYSFEAPPPLVHVKLISAVIGSDSPDSVTWDAMVALCFQLVRKQSETVRHAGHILDLNVFDGKKVDEGYKYLPTLKASYQRVSAQHAAKIIGKAARYLKVGAHVDFVWRQKEDAFAPGKFAALSYDLTT